jgi:hypothetical protein
MLACAMAVMAGLVALTHGAVIDGAIVIAVALFIFRRFWNGTRRKRELLRRGYFAGQRAGAQWIYEELHQGEVLAIEFTLEYAGRGGYDIHIPGELAWRETMPAWARERREEIVERLGAVFKRSEMHVDT